MSIIFASFCFRDVLKVHSRHFTHPEKPGVNYPEGFQGNNIPVHGPTVAKLIEDRVEGALS